MKEGLCKVTNDDICFKDVEKEYLRISARISECSSAIKSGKYKTTRKFLFFFRVTEFDEGACMRDFSDILVDNHFAYLFSWDGETYSCYGASNFDILRGIVSMIKTSSELYLSPRECRVARAYQK